MASGKTLLPFVAASLLSSACSGVGPSEPVPCEDVTLEDNDSRARATELGLIAGRRIDEMPEIATDDDDWFTLLACPGERLRVVTVSSDGILQLYDDALATVGQKTHGPDSTEIVYTAEDRSRKSRLYASMSAVAQDVCAPYALVVESLALPDDRFETEPAVLSGAQRADDLIALDDDQFQLTDCIDPKVRIESRDGRLGLELLDAGRVVAQATSTGGVTLLTGRGAGPFELKVSLEDGRCVPYSIQTACTDPEVPPEEIPIDPADSPFEDSASLSDPRLYTLTLCAGGVLDLELTGAANLALLDALGSVVGTGSPLQYVSRETFDQVLVAEVTATSTAPVAFALAVDVRCECLEDAWEPNDSGPASIPTEDLFDDPTGGVLLGTLTGDTKADWFELPVCANGRTTVSIDYDDAEGDIRLAASPPQFGAPEIASASGSLGHAEMEIPMATTPRTYRLEVLGFGDADSCQRYSLRYRNPTCTCLDPFDPSDDAMSGATPIQSGDVVAERFVGSESGDDWYAFSGLCCGGAITVTYVTNASSSETRVEIVAPDGTLLAADDFGTSAGGLQTFTAYYERFGTADPADVFIRVVESGGGCGKYELSVVQSGACRTTGSCAP